jgi:hypothetical protein
MKMARSSVLLAAIGFAGASTLCAAACSNSSSTTTNGGDDAGSVGPVDSGALRDAAVADTGGNVQGDSSMAPEDAGIPDAGSAGSDGASEEAAAGPACGPPPARYTLLTDAGTVGDAGVGLVEDNTTGLVWMSTSVGGEQSQEQTQMLAASYCASLGLRLPTESEALGIAAANYASCAFSQWSTWTSTASSQQGDAWTVDFLGDTYQQLADNFPNAVLCVRGGQGDD